MTIAIDGLDILSVAVGMEVQVTLDSVKVPMMRKPTRHMIAKTSICGWMLVF